VHSSILPHLIVLVTMLSGPGAPFNRPWCGIMTLVSFPAPTDPSEIGHDHRADGAEPSPLGDRLPDAATGETQEVTAVELPDEQIAIARSAAVEDAGDAKQVGEYLGATREDEIALTAAFAATDRGYRGWHWSVTLAVVDRARPTVSEVVLLPGERALLAPPWLPWDQRIRAGDVGAGDLLPTAPADPRLVPGYVDSDDPDLQELEYEFGFGRERVLSRDGRDDAAQRWHDGPFGPDDIIAQQAPAQCVSCGFYVPLRGLLGMALGACANEYSPADGRVVDAEYGCGAHSSTKIDAPLISASTETVVDELTLEVHRRPPPRSAPEPLAEVESGDEPASVEPGGTPIDVPDGSVDADEAPVDAADGPTDGTRDVTADAGEQHDPTP
jgi:hypothetical protein